MAPKLMYISYDQWIQNFACQVQHRGIRNVGVCGAKLSLWPIRTFASKMYSGIPLKSLSRKSASTDMHNQVITT